MKSPTSVGSTLNVGHRQALSCRKFIQCIRNGWWSWADNRGSNQSYKIWSPIWLPTNQIIVVDPTDQQGWDFSWYILDLDKNVNEGLIDLAWIEGLEAKSKGTEVQLELGLWIENT